jgi:membrane-bound inhibitor of C-type lysozyme
MRQYFAVGLPQAEGAISDLPPLARRTCSFARSVRLKSQFPDIHVSIRTARLLSSGPATRVEERKYLRLKDCYSTAGHLYRSTRYVLWILVIKSQRNGDQARYNELRYA